MKAEVDERVPAEKQNKKPRAAAKDDRVWREIVSWFWVIVAFILIEGGVVQARVIPSGSMENTVLIGDHLIVSRMGYDAGIPFTDYHIPLWRNPKRQQIIVFRAPLADQGFPDFIKRCVGVPGDHLKIVEGKVYVNDVLLNEPYALHRPGAEDMAPENFPARASELMMVDNPDWAAELVADTVNGELVVPPGHYFMMGDNRDNSNDGRFWGFVPRENIIGTPVLIYMSIDAPEDVWEPGHIGERFETYFRAIIHPSEIRWRRLFRTF
ncbi:MAG: signal peptidase I [Candidatus Acidiferrales bacterium]